MDNNFVNIDDLVRQRLEGGEEQERSGAWLHMRDLLDQEMPRRTGFIYWRRMLSAVAVLLLIATISVGGYELSANRSSNKTDNVPVVATAIVDHSTKNTIAANNETNNDQVTSAGISSNNQVNNDDKDSKKIAATNNIHLKNNQKHKRPSATQKASNYTGPGNNTVSNEQLPVAANHVNGKSEGIPLGENNPVNENVPVNKSDVAMIPSANASNKEGKPEEAAKSKPSIGKLTSADTKPATELAKNTSHKTAPGTVKTSKEEKMKALPLSSKPSAVSDAKAASITKSGVAVSSKTSGDKLPLNNHAITNKKKKGIATNTIKNDPVKKAAKKAIVKNDKNMISSRNLAVASSVSKEQKPVAANLSKTIKPKSIAANNTITKNVTKEATAANEKKDQRVIQKLVLYMNVHYIQTDPGNRYSHFDTISMQTLIQDMAVAEENNPVVPAAKKSSAARTVATNTPANNSVASNGNNSGSTAATTDPQILPGASASANSKPATGKNENSAAAKSGGSAAVSSLESAFNDIKYNVKGMQFAAGLTAGINGTFFGPSSFNGFQFGVTGDFIFSDEWSFGSELKYFQRINNNYALNDDYYTYTPNATGGGWTKQEITNSYIFSTLHSIEMPLIIKYANGKFNFYVGGNLVYAFSINQAQVPQPSTTTTTVATIGNDTQPKINPADPQSDFNSRFGVGCLFGISYKVSPNVNLDLRNVMTLWDNANSPGAKYISDQLYKSPSLQLSVGYRLGNKKNKE